QVQSLGAPAEALLIRSGIHPDLLAHPSAAAPLKKVFQWIELACQSLGTEHLGLHVGDATSNADLGHYGRLLEGALTLHHYIQKGMSLYHTVVVGQSFWLSLHGDKVRINLGSPWTPGLGDYQAHLSSFAVTIANIRKFAGPDWTPTEISFGFKARESLSAEMLGAARVAHRPGQSYLEFPRAMLGLQRCDGARALAMGQPTPPKPLPQDLAGLVELQIESLLDGQSLPVDLVADSLGMSRRSLQRGLAAHGVSYTDLLSTVRLRRAAEWLERSDKPVLEVALDLGYTDASNFTRAFRRQTGISPRAYRDSSSGDEPGGEPGVT
ncbi:helix-turn-helix transcriptional regulator, partial [Thiorhodococcus minor]